MARYLPVGLAIFIILFLRINNVDMTEGRLLVEFWYWWALVVALCIFQVLLGNRGE